MTFCKMAFQGVIPSLLALTCLTTAVSAQGAPGYQAPPQSDYRVAERPMPTTPETRVDFTAQQPNEHPLMPALRWARGGRTDLAQVVDYSATVIKRERIDGKLNEPEYMALKVRHEPFSAYMKFLAPDGLKGQEALYIKGANDGKMWAHGTGLKKMFGTQSLEPTSFLAMQGNRYPITEIGVLNLIDRLVEVAEHDIQFGECEVKFYPGATINKRTCTCIQVVHPTPRREFRFHLVRIYVDDELNIPIRYESYEWPKTEGGKPELTEEYTYLNLKLNNGFTDQDFSIENPEYEFN